MTSPAGVNSGLLTAQPAIRVFARIRDEAKRRVTNSSRGKKKRLVRQWEIDKANSQQTLN